MNETTFSKKYKKAGSQQQTVDVSRNGEPFGQLWTWANTRTTRHPWHAKPLGGEHATFETLKDAKAYIASC